MSSATANTLWWRCQNILGAAGISATEREFALVSEQVVKIIARVAKHLNHDAIKFDEAAASKRINESKGA
ncbi:hypothetical protein [Yersinia pestis]|uniref:hypothetical protein n=1 Tax=Yersinia pestis TaxID=632 RepID=UPI001CC27D7A|nr:hypothetical protein [Yersinia pestis]